MQCLKISSYSNIKLISDMMVVKIGENDDFKFPIGVYVDLIYYQVICLYSDFWKMWNVENISGMKVNGWGNWFK